MQAERIGLALARPVGHKRLQDERPRDALDVAHGREGATVRRVRRLERGGVILDRCRSQHLAAAGGVLGVQLVGGASEGTGPAGTPDARPDGGE